MLRRHADEARRFAECNANARTTGAILMVSGRVPKTLITRSFVIKGKLLTYVACRKTCVNSPLKALARPRRARSIPHRAAKRPDAR